MIYKIRNKKTGLYYSQLNPNYWKFMESKWNKTGKTWNDPRDIIKIVHWFSTTQRTEEYNYFMENCEIVEFEIIEKAIIPISFQKYLQNYLDLPF